MPVSIIVPVLDEAADIVAALEALAPLRARGARSSSSTAAARTTPAALAKPLADVVIASARGRATQMNAGAADRAEAMCCCSCMPTRACRPMPTD